IQGDTNGDRTADFEIGLTGSLAPTSSDFLFFTPLPAAAALVGWSSVGTPMDLAPLNQVVGSAVVDRLKGSSLADYITGGDGADYITAGAGDDVIQGGLGRDYLTGGSGADTFYYANVNELGDVLTDFEAAQDQIDLADLAGLPAAAQNAAWSWLGTGG